MVRKGTIEPIPREKAREYNSTFKKRKLGLLKKAYELSNRCGVNVQILVVDNNNDIHKFFCEGSKNGTTTSFFNEQQIDKHLCYNYKPDKYPFKYSTKNPPDINEAKEFYDESKPKASMIIKRKPKFAIKNLSIDLLNYQIMSKTFSATSMEFYKEYKQFIERYYYTLPTNDSLPLLLLNNLLDCYCNRDNYAVDSKEFKMHTLLRNVSENELIEFFRPIKTMITYLNEQQINLCSKFQEFEISTQNLQFDNRHILVNVDILTDYLLDVIYSHKPSPQNTEFIIKKVEYNSRNFKEDINKMMQSIKENKYLDLCQQEQNKIKTVYDPKIFAQPLQKSLQAEKNYDELKKNLVSTTQEIIKNNTANPKSYEKYKNDSFLAQFKICFSKTISQISKIKFFHYQQVTDKNNPKEQTQNFAEKINPLRDQLNKAIGFCTTEFSFTQNPDEIMRQESIDASTKMHLNLMSIQNKLNVPNLGYQNEANLAFIDNRSTRSNLSRYSNPLDALLDNNDGRSILPIYGNPQSLAQDFNTMNSVNYNERSYVPNYINPQSRSQTFNNMNLTNISRTVFDNPYCGNVPINQQVFDDITQENKKINLYDNFLQNTMLSTQNQNSSINILNNSNQLQMTMPMNSNQLHMATPINSEQFYKTPSTNLLSQNELQKSITKKTITTPNKASNYFQAPKIRNNNSDSFIFK